MAKAMARAQMSIRADVLANVQPMARADAWVTWVNICFLMVIIIIVIIIGVSSLCHVLDIIMFLLRVSCRVRLS